MTPRSDLRPALAASVALHLAILLAALIAMRNAPPVKVISVTPVTLITSPGEANVRPAEQAAERQAAAAPEPSPEPPTPEPMETSVPEPAPVPSPEPAPQPIPRRHYAKPAPTPKPEPLPKLTHRPARPPTPRPAPEPEPHPTPRPKPRPKLQPISKPEPQTDLDLSALSKSARRQTLDLTDLSRSARQDKLNLADLSKSAPSPLNLSALAGGRRGSAAKGALRAETDRQARQATGAATAMSGDQLGALQAKLNRLWNPNCGVEGSAKMVIRVRLRLTADQRLAGAPSVLSQTSAGASADVVAASEQRAVSAVVEGAPYDELPKNGPKDIVLRFNAKQACGG